MANPPRLQVHSLPGITPQEQAATMSPARGAEMTNFLRARLTGRRNNAPSSAPPLVHSWCFWHDRQERTTSPPNNNNHGETSSYEDRLEPLANITDVREFWSVFNNFDISALALRDSIHLFHKGVKPIWEDPRNARGGAWTFRVPTEKAQEFWKEVCVMAIGEMLQGAVEDPGREVFRDDICGISLGVRTRAVLVQVWNRDGNHEAGIERLRSAITENLSEGLRPKEDRLVYYKKHSEHGAFGKTSPVPSVESEDRAPGASSLRSEMQSLDAVLKDT